MIFNINQLYYLELIQEIEKMKVGYLLLVQFYLFYFLMFLNKKGGKKMIGKKILIEKEHIYDDPFKN